METLVLMTLAWAVCRLLVITAPIHSSPRTRPPPGVAPTVVARITAIG